MATDKIQSALDQQTAHTSEIYALGRYAAMCIAHGDIARAEDALAMQYQVCEQAHVHNCNMIEVVLGGFVIISGKSSVF